MPEGELSDDTDSSGESAPGSAGGSDESDESESSSGFRYRTQRRGGKGLRDIKTTDRNGPVIGIVPVKDDDELMMMTARGKIQRVKVSDFNPIGRNTQGVRIMSLEEGDTLAAIVCVPREEREEGEETPEAVPEA
jgi:DNA gyrase subunit A